MTKPVQPAATGGTADLRRLNAELVRRALLAVPSATKRSLAAATGLSVATCGSLLEALVAAGEARELVAEGRVGRPARRFAYDTHASLLALAHLGSESGTPMLECRVVNALGASVFATAAEDPGPDPEKLLRCLARIRASHRAIKGVAVSFPSPVRRGRIWAPAEFRAFDGCPLQARLERRFGLPARVENDTKLAALGYAHAHPAEAADGLVYLAYADCVLPGGGLILNGRLVRGRDGFAGEVAWMPPGEDRARILKAMGSPAGVVAVVGDAVQAAAALVNPATIVLCGGMFMDRTVRDGLERLATKRLPAEVRPRLVFQPTWRQDVWTGLFASGAELLRGPVRLVLSDDAGTAGNPSWNDRKRNRV